MDLPEVGVVVVNWNNYDDTAACLSHLADLEYPNYHVTVVDNGSQDGSGDRLAKEFDWCDVVFNERNRGFGAGCNTGIDHLLSVGVDFVLLLNNDAIVEPDFLGELTTVAEESGASVVGARIEDESGDSVNASPSKYPDMFFYSGYRTNLPVISVEKTTLPDRWWETDRVEGAGVLLSRDILIERRQSVGYFLDDSLFMYGEEIELAMWCRKRDRTSVIAADAVVHHRGGASSARSFQLYYLTRNRILVAHEHFYWWQRIAFDGLYIVSRIALAARYLKRREVPNAKAILSGLIDGYRKLEGQQR